MDTGNRWTILTLLFAIRLSMAIQFQSVAAIAPIVMNEFGVGPGDVGLLIGLYLAPDPIIALPGGEIGRRYGDKSAVLFGLALTVGGGLMMVFTTTWSWLLGTRLLAGVGGVLLNVLMAKMVADWFSGKEIATAMAIFVNSWPVGIALALVILPPLASVGGVTAVYVATSAFALLGLIAPSALLQSIVGSDRYTWCRNLADRSDTTSHCCRRLHLGVLQCCVPDRFQLRYGNADRARIHLDRGRIGRELRTLRGIAESRSVGMRLCDSGRRDSEFERTGVGRSHARRGRHQVSLGDGGAHARWAGPSRVRGSGGASGRLGWTCGGVRDHRSGAFDDQSRRGRFGRCAAAAGAGAPRRRRTQGGEREGPLGWCLCCSAWSSPPRWAIPSGPCCGSPRAWTSSPPR
jgi:hypothetical protein